MVQESLPQLTGAERHVLRIGVFFGLLLTGLTIASRAGATGGAAVIASLIIAWGSYRALEWLPLD